VSIEVDDELKGARVMKKGILAIAALMLLMPAVASARTRFSFDFGFGFGGKS